MPVTVTLCSFNIRLYLIVSLGDLQNNQIKYYENFLLPIYKHLQIFNTSQLEYYFQFSLQKVIF